MTKETGPIRTRAIPRDVNSCCHVMLFLLMGSAPNWGETAWFPCRPFLATRPLAEGWPATTPTSRSEAVIAVPAHQLQVCPRLQSYVDALEASSTDRIAEFG